MITSYRPDEMMAIAGAREIDDGKVCLVGIGLPARAAILAKRMHAPHAVLVYESGVIDTNPTRAPLSIGDGDLANNSKTIVSIPEMFNYWLQGGRIDLGFLGAAQIDRWANINTTVVGSYDEPTVRLPGAGGAPEIASFARDVIVIVRHTTRSLVEKVDFVTSVGQIDEETRREYGLSGGGPSRIVTDLGILRYRPEAKEFVLDGIYQGVDIDLAQEQTGWDLQFSDELEEIAPPSESELSTLREISGD